MGGYLEDAARADHNVIRGTSENSDPEKAEKTTTTLLVITILNYT